MRRLFSTSMVLGVVLMAGRAAGFFREMQISAMFGVSRDADFAVILLTTPDLLVNLLLAGGLGAVLIPEFGRLDAPGRTRLFLKASLLVALLFGLLALAIAIWPWLLITILAPGALSVPVDTYVMPFAVAALAVPLAGLAGVTTALLNAEGRFFTAGSGALVFNATIIAALLLYSGVGQALQVLALAIVIGAGLRYLFQALASLRHFSFGPSAVPATDFTGISKRFVQALGVGTLVLLVPVMLRAVMSLNGAGNIAAFNYATRLVELPIGIAIATIGSVAFPLMSRAHASENRAEARTLYLDGLGRALAIALAIAIPSIWFAPPLVTLVFGRGRIGADELRLIGDLARLGFLTLPLVALSSMTIAYYNARLLTGRLLRLTLACMLVVPVAAMPGWLAGDVRLTMVVLPVFHLVFAVVLVRGSGEPIAWQAVLRRAGWPALIAAGATALAALAHGLWAGSSAMGGSVLALAAMGAAMLAMAALNGSRAS